MKFEAGLWFWPVKWQHCSFPPTASHNFWHSASHLYLLFRNWHSSTFQVAVSARRPNFPFHVDWKSLFRFCFSHHSKHVNFCPSSNCSTPCICWFRVQWYCIDLRIFAAFRFLGWNLIKFGRLLFSAGQYVLQDGKSIACIPLLSINMNGTVQIYPFSLWTHWVFSIMHFVMSIRRLSIQLIFPESGTTFSGLGWCPATIPWITAFFAFTFHFPHTFLTTIRIEGQYRSIEHSRFVIFPRTRFSISYSCLSAWKSTSRLSDTWLLSLVYCSIPWSFHVDSFLTYIFLSIDHKSNTNCKFYLIMCIKFYCIYLLHFPKLCSLVF